MTAREILLGNSRGQTSARFTSVEMDSSDLENGQILQLQQRIIDGMCVCMLGYKMKKKKLTSFIL